MLHHFLLFSILIVRAYVGTSAPTRNAYTWNVSANAFVPVPMEINKSSAPSLAPGFYNSSRPVILPMLSNSQCNQDVTVYELLGKKERGFFVDLAAHEWKWISNSLALEQHASWNGICIEPIPHYSLGIMENRRCTLVTNPVYSISNEHVSFKSDIYRSGIVGPDMDNKENEKSKQSYDFVTVTLLSVLNSFKAPNVIDYFSLDIEGAEFHALKHFDFGMYTFLVATIERPTEELHHLLTKHKYWFLRVLKFYEAGGKKMGIIWRMPLCTRVYSKF